MKKYFSPQATGAGVSAATLLFIALWPVQTTGGVRLKLI